MTNPFNHSQQQLLKALGILPLQLVEAFENHHTDSVEPTNFIAPDLSQPIAADIALALAGRRQWLINPTSEVVLLDEAKLITPDLTLLTSAAQKRALWQLLYSLPSETTAELE